MLSTRQVLLGILLLSSLNFAIGFKSSVSATLITKPSPSVSTYNFKNCILLRMGIYYKSDKDIYSIYEDGKVNEDLSKCGSETEEAILNIEFEKVAIGFTIGLGDNKTVKIKEIVGYYKEKKEPQFFRSLNYSYFETNKPGHRYKCNSEQNVTTTDGGLLFLQNFSYEVLRDPTKLQFYQPVEVCSEDEDASEDGDGWSNLSIIMLIASNVLLVLLVLYMKKKEVETRFTF